MTPVPEDVRELAYARMKAKALIAWLRKRGGPDSGIRYSSNAFNDHPEVILRGPDAVFVKDHFHGPGATALAGALETALTQTEAQPAIPAGERGWLIELKTALPVWWTLEGGEEGTGWTHDVSRAIRFARQVDAESYIWDTGWTEAFASEHDWSDPSPRYHAKVAALSRPDPVAPQETRGALQAILDERSRQINDEHWSSAHDDTHRDGELLHAAVIYLHCDPENPAATPMDGDVPMGWPWNAEWWKPKDRRSNLIRAGALCLAEHDRLVRAGRPTGPADHKLAVAIGKLTGHPDPELPAKDWSEQIGGRATASPGEAQPQQSGEAVPEDVRDPKASEVENISSMLFNMEQVADPQLRRAAARLIVTLYQRLHSLSSATPPSAREAIPQVVRDLIAAAQRVYDKLASETASVNILDQEALGVALAALKGGKE